MATIKTTRNTSLPGNQVNDFTLIGDQIKSVQTVAFDGLVLQQAADGSKDSGSISDKLGYDFTRVTVDQVAIATPAYREATEDFGVLQHIDAPNVMWNAAQLGILKLREDVKEDDADSLVSRVKAFIERQYQDGEIPDSVLDRFFGNVMQKGDNGVLLRDGKIPRLKILGLTPIPAPGDTVSGQNNSDLKENDQTALFGTGRVLRDDIREVQQLRAALLRYRRWQLRQVKIKEGERERIREQLPAKHRALATLNRQRVEARGDYQVAQQLVRENWQQVAEQYAQRAEVLNNHKGLFYARVRETPFSRVLPRELPLRHVAPDDIVPGCAMTDQDIPKELQTFLDSVLDVPVADWQALRERYRELPGRERLFEWQAKRVSRMQYRVDYAFAPVANALALRMTSLRSANQALVRDLAQRSFTDKASLVDLQRDSTQVLSLEDLLGGSSHRLRGIAETLHDRLNQATVCILDQLRSVRPSLRLKWAEAAENDTIDVQRPDSWPGIDEAREDDFNGIRTLAELIDWWYRQLYGKAAAASRSAIGNLMRACLLLAADDDPRELLHGRLKTLPGRLLDGDRLRVTLNREALPGTLLQLLDNNSRMVGTLRVDDVDDQGAITTITQVVDKSAIPDSGFTLTGFALPGIKR